METLGFYQVPQLLLIKKLTAQQIFQNTIKKYLLQNTKKLEFTCDNLYQGDFKKILRALINVH